MIDLTKSCREATRPEKHILTRSRKLCCFYCLCVLLFITNNLCNTPLHVLLTDVLVSHTGTQEKIKILTNLVPWPQLTHMLDIVQKKRQEGNTPLLSTFVTISVDNFGFLRSHAAVYSGNQHRSWQGTTVQALIHLDDTSCTSLNITEQEASSDNQSILHSREPSTCTQETQSLATKSKDSHTCSATIETTPSLSQISARSQITLSHPQTIMQWPHPASHRPNKALSPINSPTQYHLKISHQFQQLPYRLLALVSRLLPLPHSTGLSCKPVNPVTML